MSRIDTVTSQKMTNASLFAMAMVVAIHTAGRSIESIDKGSILWWIESLGHYGAFRLAVPFFFVCSGYFLAGHMEESGWWKRECVKRIKSLLVPYVFWSICYALLPLAVFFFANLIHGRIAFWEQACGLRFWINALGLNPFAWPRLTPLWYVRCLIVLVVASPLLHRFINNMRLWALFLIWAFSFAVGIYGLHSQCKIYLMLAKCFNISGMFYFGCGIFWRLNHVCLPLQLHDLALTTGVIMLIGEVLSNFWGVKCIVPGLIPMLLYGVWSHIPEMALPKWLTSATFPIFLMHMPLWKVIGFFRPMPVETVGHWLFKWAIGFLGSMAIALLMRKLFPSTAKMLFGGR